jgi:hypothetical protein
MHIPLSMVELANLMMAAGRFTDLLRQGLTTLAPKLLACD